MSTISYSKIEIENFEIEKPEDNERTPAQKLSFVRYKNKGRNGQLMMKTPIIQIISGGIPQEGTFFETDQKRAKGFKIPFGNTLDELTFKQKMRDIDAWMGSEEFKRKILGLSDKLLPTVDYVPIVRSPQNKEDDDDEEENKKKTPIKKNTGPRPDYMKAFFELDYTTGKPVPKLYHKQGEEKKLYEYSSLDEAKVIVCYMSFCRFVLTMNKLYLTKNKDQKTGKRTYGTTWKIVCIEAEPPLRLGGKSELPEDPFISDDEDDEIKETTMKITKLNLAEQESCVQIDELDENINVKETSNIQQAKGVEEEEAEEAEEEEAEAEVIQTIKPKSKKSGLDEGLEVKKKGRSKVV